MNPILLMTLAILAGSLLSLVGGSLIFLTKKRRTKAILFALPFGAGALLAAAFFDLLPESFELGEPRTLLLWALVGFTGFFLLERLASWFHHHHEHAEVHAHRHDTQNAMVMIGDFLHNAIDGVAIGAAFLANPTTGLITTLAVRSAAVSVPTAVRAFMSSTRLSFQPRESSMPNVPSFSSTNPAASKKPAHWR